MTKKSKKTTGERKTEIKLWSFLVLGVGGGC